MPKDTCDGCGMLVGYASLTTSDGDGRHFCNVQCLRIYSLQRQVDDLKHTLKYHNILPKGTVETKESGVGPGPIGGI